MNSSSETSPFETTQHDIAGIVLAAGQSNRFGSDKRLAAYDAQDTLLSKSISLIEPFCSRLFVVTKPADCDKERELLGPWWGCEKLAQVCARDASQGMGSSLANGIEQLRAFEKKQNRRFTGVLLMLADMPYIAPITIAKVVAAHSADKIVVSRYRPYGEKKSWGHPVVFGRLWFDALQALRGDRGGRAIIEANAKARVEIAVDDPGVLRDVDKPGDLG